MNFFKKAKRVKKRSESIVNTTESRDQYREKLTEVRKSLQVKLPTLRSAARSLDLEQPRYCEVTLAGVLGTPNCVRQGGYLLYRGSPLPVTQHSFGRKRDELSLWGDSLVTKGVVRKQFLFS